MELIVVNLTSGVRRERLDGRDYLVASVSMIVPGVLNGSQGPILYQLEDMKATADAWNGMPIVVNHPSDAEGKPLSARDPQVYEKFGIGQVYKARVDNKLTAEGWFDVEKTRKVDGRILNALQNNQKLELSTGLNLDQEPAQGVWNDGNGRQTSYTSIARRYRPDHLAILPDQPGACSLADGCGVNNSEPDAGKSSVSEQPPNNQENISMFKFATPELRQAAITAIVANCACWKDDAKGLEAFDDRTVNALHEGVENGSKLRMMTQKIKDDEEAKAKAAAAAANPAAPVANAATPADEPKPFDMNQLPADVREDLVFARNAKQKQKDQLIDRLVASLPEAERKDEALSLNKASLTELERMVKYLPAVQNAQPEPTYSGLYAGAGAGNVVANRSADDNKPAGGSLSAIAPVFNWDPSLTGK